MIIIEVASEVIIKNIISWKYIHDKIDKIDKINESEETELIELIDKII